MNVKKHPLDDYKSFLLNRSTTNIEFVELIENMLAAEDFAAQYCFHKIMIHNWNFNNEVLFDTLAEYFSAWFIPVYVTRQRDITTFYTSSLNFILRLTRLDFMFSFDKTMFNIDVLFNNKTSVDFFDSHVTVDDVISSVVSGRFNDKKVLDLSNFCNDQEMKEKMLHFYKLSLLANFKILMLRVGKDTKSLNLSNNQLTQPPLDIMNFFIKGDLTEINLSYNKINSISDLVRVSSKIEKLWVEGNPLCEDHDPSMYVKQITVKFPRLTELDGVKLFEFGVGFPFRRNYMCKPTKQAKIIVEQFLMLYFSHYDTPNRSNNIDGFYDEGCLISVTAAFTDDEKLSMPFLHTNVGKSILAGKLKTSPYLNVQSNRCPVGLNINTHIKMCHLMKLSTLNILNQLPKSQHDPTTFTVDLIQHDDKCMMLVVDGIYKDLETLAGPDVFRFRRTFVFKAIKLNHTTTGYKIHREMFHITLPTPQQLANCFRFPTRNMNTFELVNPEREETEALGKIFCHLSHLRKEEAVLRLRLNKWDLKKTLVEFIADFSNNKVDPDAFMEEDDFSDTSSLIDDEMYD